MARLKIGDTVRLHGIVKQLAKGNPDLPELGYAYDKLLKVIGFYQKRDHSWIEVGPDECGNTYLCAERQAEYVGDIK